MLAFNCRHSTHTTILFFATAVWYIHPYTNYKRFDSLKMIAVVNLRPAADYSLCTIIVLNLDGCDALTKRHAPWWCSTATLVRVTVAAPNSIWMSVTDIGYSMWPI